ncbi:MAG TPA: CARDB domain-containing protein, partial [Candidatus Acidoferrum sp.]|nr:CARDB domain-containing protein [Candidatus Acidoferrum sp.]
TGGGHSVSNLVLTFDDAGAGLLPSSNPDVSGTYRPSVYPGPVVLPPPAPGPAYGTMLAGVAGYNPNGTWSLFVYDDTVGDSGFIAGGWSLNLTTGAALRGMADLAVGLSSAPTTVYLGGVMTNTVWVTNLGPATATGVLVTNSLSSGQVVVTSLGSVAAGAVGSASVVIAPTQPGEITTTVVAAGNEVDLNPSNNSAQATTLVIAAAPAVLSGQVVNGQMRLTLTADPGFVYAIQGSSNLTAWASLVTNTVPSGGTIHYTDSSSSSLTQRFYRALRLSP